MHRWQGQTDVALNDAGRRQAARLGERLDCLTFDAIYTSDMRRTEETARFARPSGAPVRDPRLREMRFGTFEGKTWDDMSEEDRAALDRWRVNPYKNRLPGGESFEDLSARLQAWRATLPPQGRFLVFTHGGPIRCLLWDIMGHPQQRAWTIMLGNASITRIGYSSGNVQDGPAHVHIITVNDCAHLDGVEASATAGAALEKANRTSKVEVENPRR